MRKLLLQLIFTLTLLITLCAGLQSASAQTPGTPDCLIPFDTGAGVGAGTYNFPVGNGFDNRTAGCVTWTLEWQSNATATVVFQSSLGVAAPSSYVTYTGTTVFNGTGIMTFSNLASGTVVDTPWVRVQAVTSATGQTKGVLYGYKTGTTGGTGGGGGGGGGSGCTSPCAVVGTAAAGAPPSGDPVQVAGQDGTDIRTLLTDTTGRLEVVPASSANACPNPCPVLGSVATGSAAPNPETTGVRDDSNNVLADHAFPAQADISGSAVSSIKVVAGVSAKLIYVGHFSVSLAAGTTVSLIQGTTVSTPCDTSASTIAGPYQNAVALALDFTRDDPLTTTTAGDDLCLSFGASSTGGGFVKYSQR
jgi:hypothetical protein